MSKKKKSHLNSLNILNILWGSWTAAYPVLMEMISISGFFLIFGKSNGAPPNRFPLSFFWPSSLTEWPSNKAHRPALAWVAQFHFNLLLSANVLIFSFNFFFHEKKKWKKKKHLEMWSLNLINGAKRKNRCAHVLQWKVLCYNIGMFYCTDEENRNIFRMSFHRYECSLA